MNALAAQLEASQLDTDPAADGGIDAEYGNLPLRSSTCGAILPLSRCHMIQSRRCAAFSSFNVIQACRQAIGTTAFW